MLLGDAVPRNLHNTSDDKPYNHYSIMATVEKNWELGNLGLNDETANAFY